MGKYNELLTTQDLVYSILNQYPQARNSDSLLFLLVYEKVGKTKNIDIDNITLSGFLLHMKEYGFPTFETIRRTRQKLQAENPDLCASANVEGFRIANEKAFVDYARKKW